MKRAIFFINLFFLAFLFSLGYTAVNKTFSWDANTEADLAGYRIYMSTTSRGQVLGESSPDKVAELFTGPNPGGTEEIIILVPVGTYYFVATAFDHEGLESKRSNEISVTVSPEEGEPPGCPINLRFIIS